MDNFTHLIIAHGHPCCRYSFLRHLFTMPLFISSQIITCELNAAFLINTCPPSLLMTMPLCSPPATWTPEPPSLKNNMFRNSYHFSIKKNIPHTSLKKRIKNKIIWFWPAFSYRSRTYTYFLTAIFLSMEMVVELALFFLGVMTMRSRNKVAYRVSGGFTTITKVRQHVRHLKTLTHNSKTKKESLWLERKFN